MGQLKRFNDVERFLEDDEARGFAERQRDVFAGKIRVGSAKDDLQLWVNLPDPRGSFDAVPARGHAHIHEGQRIGPLVCKGALNKGQSLLALVGRINAVMWT